MQKIFISHELCNNTPGYAGKADIEIVSSKCMSKHDSCNQLSLKMSNHVGTHIDVPFHFDPNGKTLSEYSVSDLIFSKVQLIDFAIAPGELITKGNWLEGIKIQTDLLLIRTGFEAHRDAPIYWERAPGIHSDVGQWLKMHRPGLRAVGFDFISLTSLLHRPEGKLAHQVFLGSPSPILIIEDMKLADLIGHPTEVMVVPLRVHKADGAPVTVIASLDS